MAIATFVLALIAALILLSIGVLIIVDVLTAVVRSSEDGWLLVIGLGLVALSLSLAIVSGFHCLA